MKTRNILGIAAVGTLLTLAGCATNAADSPPAGAPASGPGATQPTDDSNGTIRVSTRTPLTVIENGAREDGPQLCVGAVAESLPPQCTGVDLIDWDWSAVDGAVEESGDVRWGEFTVTGDYDPGADTMVVTSLDTDGAEPRSGAPACTDVCLQPTDVQLEASREIMSSYDGVLSSTVDGRGVVMVTVTYDDGSLQADLDDAYGDGAVHVESVLVPAA